MLRVGFYEYRALRERENRVRRVLINVSLNLAYELALARRNVARGKTVQRVGYYVCLARLAVAAADIADDFIDVHKDDFFRYITISQNNSRSQISFFYRN